MNFDQKKGTITVLGSSGMLGSAVSRYFLKSGYSVNNIDRSIFDAEVGKIESLRAKIKDSSFIVNAVGIIKPRISSLKPEKIFLINGLFPKNLAKLASQMNIPCFHITTDCVYSGSKGNYTEDDFFDIDDLYGLSKSAGENNDCMCLRTSIIGEETNNKYSLLEWARSQAGKQVQGYTNHLWNGLTTIYLSQVIEQIYLQNLYEKGIYHIFSPKTISKYELLQIINEVYDLKLQITPASPSPAIDRSLSSKHPLSRQLVVEDLKQQITEMRQFFQA